MTMRCPKCRDDGFYYTVPEGMNPFLLGAEGVARVASRVECSCRAAQPCAHAPKKAALDSSVWCIRCAAYLGEAN